MRPSCWGERPTRHCAHPKLDKPPGEEELAREAKRKALATTGRRRYFGGSRVPAGTAKHLQQRDQSHRGTGKAAAHCYTAQDENRYGTRVAPHTGGNGRENTGDGSRTLGHVLNKIKQTTIRQRLDYSPGTPPPGRGITAPPRPDPSASPLAVPTLPVPVAPPPAGVLTDSRLAL